MPYPILSYAVPVQLCSQSKLPAQTKSEQAGNSQTRPQVQVPDQCPCHRNKFASLRVYILLRPILFADLFGLPCSSFPPAIALRTPLHNIILSTSHPLPTSAPYAPFFQHIFPLSAPPGYYRQAVTERLYCADSRPVLRLALAAVWSYHNKTAASPVPTARRDPNCLLQHRQARESATST